MKDITFRELNAGDLYFISAIADAADIDLKVLGLGSKDNESLGLNILYTIFKKIHKAKKEVNEFLSSLTGLSVKEITNLTPKSYIGLLKQLQELKGLMELFQ